MKLLVIGVGNTTPSVRVCDHFSKLRLNLATNKDGICDIDISDPDPNSNTYAQDWYEIVTTVKSLIPSNATTLIDAKIKEINPLFYGFVVGYINGSRLPYGSIKISDNSESELFYSPYSEKRSIEITYNPITKSIVFNGDDACSFDDAISSLFSKVTINEVPDSTLLTSDQLYDLGRILGVAHVRIPTPYLETTNYSETVAFTVAGPGRCCIVNNLKLSDILYKILAN